MGRIFNVSGKDINSEMMKTRRRREVEMNIIKLQVIFILLT